MRTPDSRDSTRAVTDPRAAAFGFAQRRTWIFFAWWYPSIIGICGAVYAGLSLLVGQDPENGTIQMVLGAVLAAAGWILTARPRFTRKQPTPASDIPRVEQGIRIALPVIYTVLIVGALGVAALALFMPKGASIDSFPLLGTLMAFPVIVSAGLAYTRHLMVNSSELFARWLARG